MKQSIITVGTVTHALKCRKLLSIKGIQAKLIKLDSSKIDGCSYGLEISVNDYYSAVVILRENDINFSIHNS